MLHAHHLHYSYRLLPQALALRLRCSTLHRPIPSVSGAPNTRPQYYCFSLRTSSPRPAAACLQLAVAWLLPPPDRRRAQLSCHGFQREGCGPQQVEADTAAQAGPRSRARHTGPRWRWPGRAWRRRGGGPRPRQQRRPVSCATCSLQLLPSVTQHKLAHMMWLAGATAVMVFMKPRGLP